MTWFWFYVSAVLYLLGVQVVFAAFRRSGLPWEWLAFAWPLIGFGAFVMDLHARARRRR